MEALAYQALPGLLPDQFWALTRAELALLLEGAAWREDQAWNRVAWQTNHLLNVAGKSLRRTMTIEQLLGRKLSPRDAPFEIRDPELDFQELWRRHTEKVAKAEEADEEG